MSTRASTRKLLLCAPLLVVLLIEGCLSGTASVPGLTGLGAGDSAYTFPSVAIDPLRNTLSVYMGKVELTTCELSYLDDTVHTLRFFNDAAVEMSSRVWIERVHLFSARRVVAQPVVEAIMEEFPLTEDQIQRFQPVRMVLVLSDGQRIHVEADGVGETVSWFGNLVEGLRDWWSELCGISSLRLRLTADDAMALYGVALHQPRFRLATRP